MGKGEVMSSIEHHNVYRKQKTGLMLEKHKVLSKEYDCLYQILALQEEVADLRNRREEIDKGIENCDKHLGVQSED